MKTTDSAQVKKIVLAGGCFWGTQHLLSLLSGLRRTRVGFVNSNVKNPTYKDVCTGDTGAAEGVEVEYNATVVDLPRLLDFFLQSIDPTSKDRQGEDRGTQYRTGIYYTTEAQKHDRDRNPGGYCHISRELMARARHTHILKPEAPEDALHADVNFANELEH